MNDTLDGSEDRSGMRKLLQSVVACVDWTLRVRYAEGLVASAGICNLTPLLPCFVSCVCDVAFGRWEALIGMPNDYRFLKRLSWAPLWTKFTILVYFLCKYGTLISLIGMCVETTGDHLLWITGLIRGV